MGQSFAGSIGVRRSSLDRIPSLPSLPSRRDSDACEPDVLLAAARKVVSQLRREELSLSYGDADINDFSIFQDVDPEVKSEFMRLASSDVKAKRAMGALVGAAVADSIGAILEFIPVGSPGSYFDPKTLQTFGEYNKFSLKPGQWTDDTSMGLCLADSLLVREGYDGADIRIRFWNWWNRGYNNAFRHDAERESHNSVGLGGNTSLSLMLMNQGKLTPRFEGLGEDAGNGSVMRLASVPIFFHSCTEELVMRISAESSYTTHPGPHAADACSFLGFVIARAISRPTKKSMTAAQFLDGCAEAYLARVEVEAQPEIRRLLLADQPVGSPERCWNWRDPKGPFLLETIAARGEMYNGYPVDPGYFGSYSMDGLAMALHCVYHTKNFMAAVSRCVNLLGDADSTGAICGQIAGAFYGVGAIDPRLVEQLSQWDPSSEIALRGALLYALGLDISPDAAAAARKSSASALGYDRNKAFEAATTFPKPPPLPFDVCPVPQPPMSVTPALLQATASMQLAIVKAAQRKAAASPGDKKRRKRPKEEPFGMLACTLATDTQRDREKHRQKLPVVISNSIQG